MNTSALTTPNLTVRGELGKPLGSDQTALVHHWMEFFRGGEAVLEQFSLLFPSAPISMLVYNVQNLPPAMRQREFRSNLIQRVPLLRRHFRKLLPIFPEIVRRQRLHPATRFVLSSDASVMKGVPVPDGATHICYCHSPPRYIWGLENSYLESSSHGNPIGRMVFSASLPRLRSFDRKMARRVNHFIANSRCVQDRIRRCYFRDSTIIHPPVDIDRFDANRPREDFYLIVSALVPYKRIDLAVDACSRLGRRLVVIGTGPEEANLKQRAAPCVSFLGWQLDDVVRDHFERCRAFIFPGIEDFGITACEAQAAGAPVIAFGEGGALETVKDGTTGLYFHAQTVEALSDVLTGFESRPPFLAAVCRENVAQLTPARFRRQIREFIEQKSPELFSAYAWPAEAC